MNTVHAISGVLTTLFMLGLCGLMILMIIVWIGIMFEGAVARKAARDAGREEPEQFWG